MIYFKIDGLFRLTLFLKSKLMISIRFTDNIKWSSLTFGDFCEESRENRL